MNKHNVIIRPLITEASMKAVDGGKFSFAVAKNADKKTIKNAVRGLFAVTPVSVAISLMKGKTRRVGAKRQEIAISDWKKAIVTLKKGEKIALFEPGGSK